MKQYGRLHPSCNHRASAHVYVERFEAVETLNMIRGMLRNEMDRNMAEVAYEVPIPKSARDDSKAHFVVSFGTFADSRRPVEQVALSSMAMMFDDDDIKITEYSNWNKVFKNDVIRNPPKPQPSSYVKTARRAEAIKGSAPVIL